ncbi:MAG: 3',5'-cyclic-nucleotide phosphodiesterase [Smithella sp.]
MNIKVLGCHGAQLPGYNTTGFLIGQNVLIDGGTITSVLNLKEQMKIDYIFITHAHLDHVREIMFLTDNIYYQHREKPLTIVSTRGIIETIRKNLFNNAIWPDFSKIPNSKAPMIKFQTITPGKKKQIGNLQVRAVNLHHSVETVGYIIESDGKSVIFMGDTGPTEKVWHFAGQAPELQAIFIETSLPNKMRDIADRTGHLTAFSLAVELEKLAELKPAIYIYHIKPIYRNIIKKEVSAIKDRKITILEDGQKIRI